MPARQTPRSTNHAEPAPANVILAQPSASAERSCAKTQQVHPQNSAMAWTTTAMVKSMTPSASHKVLGSSAGQTLESANSEEHSATRQTQTQTEFGWSAALIIHSHRPDSRALGLLLRSATD